jgi:hypothetical protein
MSVVEKPFSYSALIMVHFQVYLSCGLSLVAFVFKWAAGRSLLPHTSFPVPCWLKCG